MENLKRREFLKLGSSAAAASLLFPTFSNQELKAKNIEEANDYKALVCIMLSGGNDSFNMLVPTNKSSYKNYKKSRSNLALDKNSLLDLDYKDNKNQSFALHESMKNCQTLFKQKKLSFIANIGPLIKPLSKEEYFSSSLNLPLGLMSHADQLRHWLSSLPNERTNYGVAGKVADLVQKNNKNQKIPMNISLAGSNYFQNGLKTKEYAITNQGSVGLNINNKKNILDKVLYKSFNELLDTSYDNDFKQTYMNILNEAQNSHEDFTFSTKDTTLNSSFTSKDLAKDLKMLAKTIKSAKSLGMKRQTFYVLYHGWDHHDELLSSHKEMLQTLDEALASFYEELENSKLEDKVITFTTSDFGRSLTSNGNGTDHAWGGNSLVLGSSIKGGEIFGNYPSLELNSKLDIGGGVLIPTLSTDQLYAPLLSWFGLKTKAINKTLPNLKNFSRSLDLIKG